MEQVKIRPAVEGDFHFIISTWLKSFKHSSYFGKRIRNSIFFKFHHAVVTDILASPDTLVTVACDTLDENVIYGYMVAGVAPDDNTLLHYLYVKSPFRRMGVAKVLGAPLNLDKIVFSHWTFSTDWMIEKWPNAVYIPYLMS